MSYTYVDTLDGPQYTNIPESGNLFDKPVTTFNARSELYSESDLLTLELNYELNEYWQVTSVSTYSDVDDGFIWDDDKTAEPLTACVNAQFVKTLS